MKRLALFAAIFSLGLVSVTASAQYNPYAPNPGVNIGPYAYPRTGPFGSTADNTGRVMTYNFFDSTIAHANLAADTLRITPNAFVSTYVLNVTTSDSVRVLVNSLNFTYLGDQLHFVVIGASGNYVKFCSGKLNAIVSQGNATLSTVGRAAVDFTWDGTKYAETNRVVY